MKKDSLIDLRCPQPLADPEKWPRLSVRTETAVLDRRAVILSGGVLRRFFEKVLETGPVVWVNSDLLPSEEMIARLELGAVESVLEPGVVEPIDWARAALPRTLEKAGELTFRRWLKDYEQARAAAIASLDDLRYFPKFIADRGAGEIRVDAELELARLLALFSPQDERPGPAESEVLALNPTLQMIKTANEVIAIARVGERCRERAINWQEALFFDELEENPRVDLDGILSRVISGAPSRLAPTGSLSEVLSEVLSGLIADGYVLRV